MLRLAVLSILAALACAQTRIVNICEVDDVEVKPDDEFIIRSVNFGDGKYMNNAACSTTLTTGGDPVTILLNHRNFTLEPESECRFDSLCVNGVRFCGDGSYGKAFNYLVPANSSLTLTFTTDVSIVDYGFNIEVYVRLATPERVIYEPTGGTWESGLEYTRKQYHNGYGSEYTDKCARVQDQRDGSFSYSGPVTDYPY